MGPEVALAADTFRAKQLHDEYTESPEYVALLRGALGMMKVSHIDLLVVGLPVALFAVKKAALEKAMTGKHDVGDGKTVTVAKALAVAQPQGALVHYVSVHQKMAEIGKEQSLIIDPGSRTFDWLVAQGMRLVQKQSHSINRRMSDVLRLIAHAIAKDIGTPYRDYDAIDLTLRTGKSNTYSVKRTGRGIAAVPGRCRFTLKEPIAVKQGDLLGFYIPKKDTEIAARHGGRMLFVEGAAAECLPFPTGCRRRRKMPIWRRSVKRMRLDRSRDAPGKCRLASAELPGGEAELPAVRIPGHPNSPCSRAISSRPGT